MATDPRELFVHRYDELIDSAGTVDDVQALRVAAILRQLLLDESPLAHQANRETRLKLTFAVYDVPELPIPAATLILTSALNPDFGAFGKGPRSVTLDQLLGTTIIQASEKTFSIRDVVDFAANSAGGVHLSKDRGNERTALAEALATLKSTGLRPLHTALRTIADITIAGLRPLRNEISGLHAGFPIWAYYKLPRGDRISFEREQFMESAFSLDLKYGFSFNSVLKLSVQAGRGERVIYQIGTKSSRSPRFTVLTTEKRYVRCVATVAAKKILRTEAVIPRRSPLLDDCVFVAGQLCFRDDGATLRLYVNNELVSEAAVRAAKIERVFTHQVIGADLQGRRSASFEQRELILADWCLTDDERANLARYIWLEWHK